MSSSGFALERFVEAQAAVIPQVLAELAAGRKTSHWMWFVFPQRAGLGHSAMARHYAIGSIDEAIAYWRHPILGPRLLDCTHLVLNIATPKTVREIFGVPDDLKFLSSMRLFAEAAPEEPTFADALRRFGP